MNGYYYYDNQTNMMHKRSKEKEAILQFLRSTGSHPTADTVFNEMRKQNPYISLGTIYRNLRLLTDEGEINELDTVGGLSRFEANTRPHYHFRCDKCGRVFDLNEEVDTSLNQRIADKTGYKILDHILEFRGLCQECQP